MIETFSIVCYQVVNGKQKHITKKQKNKKQNNPPPKKNKIQKPKNQKPIKTYMSQIIDKKIVLMQAAWNKRDRVLCESERQIVINFQHLL